VLAYFPDVLHTGRGLHSKDGAVSRRILAGMVLCACARVGLCVGASGHEWCHGLGRGGQCWH
jgi:hypothetical protein